MLAIRGGQRSKFGLGQALPFGKFEDVFDQRVARALERAVAGSRHKLRAMISFWMWLVPS